MLLPKPALDLPARDALELARSIQEAEYASYAISSDWIDLWRSDAFTYYLSLDQVASLSIYTRHQHSPLKGLTDSSDERDRFVGDCRTLMAEVARGDPPIGEHRMRILIYPRDVYEKYKDRFINLLRLHSAGRIPCIPLITEELEDRLTPGECQDVEQLTSGRLNQALLDKVPPQPRWTAYRLNKVTEQMHGPLVFPDLLLIDPTGADTGQLWWYTGGRVRHADCPKDKTAVDAAYAVFRTLCTKGADAVWANFGSGNIGNVPITTYTGRDLNALFFALKYYRDWLEWIEENSGTDPDAATLAGWIAGEWTTLTHFIDSLPSNGTDEVHVLDVGCGFGRHLIDLAKTRSNVTGLGIDVVPGMVAEAAHDARIKDLEQRLYFCEDDAVRLETCRDGEFDAAICMTNTLGNLEEGKAAEAISQMYRALKPGGKLLISVYGASSVSPRLASYKTVKLHVKEVGRRIKAAEGLESSYFTEDELKQLLTRGGFQNVSVTKPGGIGLAARGSKA